MTVNDNTAPSMASRALSAEGQAILRPERSLTALALSRLVRNRLAVMGLVVLCLLIAGSALAPLLTA
jgi:hypothetical protein